MSKRLSHSDYFTDRRSEYELCRDFPADEVLIDGLHAMQTHFMRRGMAIDIPVVRVMNTAHWLACYMFATTCSGDQAEYDVLTYDSMGQDKQLAVISLIVLAAMLKRTDGMRARNCRSVLLEDRTEDFYDGVSLYEQFLRSAEKHFAEEDFLIDTHNQILQLQEENTRLVSENIQLKYTITKMENQQNNQYLAPVYQGCTFTTTTNNYYQPPAPAQESKPENALYVIPVPEEGNYNAVREYIEERKKYDKVFAQFCRSNTRKRVCEFLSDEFGWIVDEHSLGANMNRNR